MLRFDIEPREVKNTKVATHKKSKLQLKDLYKHHTVAGKANMEIFPWIKSNRISIGCVICMPYGVPGIVVWYTHRVYTPLDAYILQA